MPKRKKNKLKWIQETIELQENHNWKTDEGYQIFVAGRGAVRFDVPQSWIFEPGEKSFKFLDGKPPNDNCRLEVSFNQLPPSDWSLFPLKHMLQQVLEKESRDSIETSEITTLKRSTARLVWAQTKFIDPNEHREAYSRICIGLGSNVQCLITLDYWVEDAERVLPVWDHVLETLVLGLYINDPRTGFARPD
jgi:hypothetical protein